MPTTDITRLLRQWREGNDQALQELVPLVYDDLKGVANRHLRRERTSHTLQPTALVHEAYLRLAASEPPSWQDRVHFLAVAANVMRRVLVDHARSRQAVKRGGGAITVSFDEVLHRASSIASQDTDVLALDEALAQLAELDPRQARIVELRFFGGLTIEETAEEVGVSVPVVVRETRAARAWLYDRLKSE